MFHLRGALAVRTGESEKVIGKYRIANRAIGRSAVHKEFAVDIEKQRLVKLLTANVGPELQRMIPHNFAKAVRPLKCVAHLWHFTLTIVPNGESATHLDEWHTLSCCPEIGMNPQGVVW